MEKCADIIVLMDVSIGIRMIEILTADSIAVTMAATIIQENDKVAYRIKDKANTVLYCFVYRLKLKEVKHNEGYS